MNVVGEGTSMIQAYVLIQAAVGKGAQVAAAVARVPGVTSADLVTGPYDTIARAGANDMDELGRFILTGIQGVPGVVRTLTCPVVRL